MVSNVNKLKRGEKWKQRGLRRSFYFQDVGTYVPVTSFTKMVINLFESIYYIVLALIETLKSSNVYLPSQRRNPILYSGDSSIILTSSLQVFLYVPSIGRTPTVNSYVCYFWYYLRRYGVIRYYFSLSLAGTIPSMYVSFLLSFYQAQQSFFLLWSFCPRWDRNTVAATLHELLLQVIHAQPMYSIPKHIGDRHELQIRGQYLQHTQYTLSLFFLLSPSPRDLARSVVLDVHAR